MYPFQFWYFQHLQFMLMIHCISIAHSDFSANIWILTLPSTGRLQISYYSIELKLSVSALAYLLSSDFADFTQLVVPCNVIIMPWSQPRWRYNASSSQSRLSESLLVCGARLNTFRKFIYESFISKVILGSKMLAPFSEEASWNFSSSSNLELVLSMHRFNQRRCRVYSINIPIRSQVCGVLTCPIYSFPKIRCEVESKFSAFCSVLAKLDF